MWLLSVIYNLWVEIITQRWVGRESETCKHMEDVGSLAIQQISVIAPVLVKKWLLKATTMVHTSKRFAAHIRALQRKEDHYLSHNAVETTL